MDKVAPEPNTGCWLWLGAMSRNGYGTAFDGKKQRRAHRLAYVLFKGPIPDGLVIDHICRVRCCVNPDHLRAVTMGENIACGDLPRLVQERAVARTHCVHGHPATPDNLYIRGKFRSCMVCNRIRARDWYRANKAKRKVWT